MAVFLAGCCAWITDRAPGPGNLFHPGAIDVAGAAVIAAAFAVARQAARRVTHAAALVGRPVRVASGYGDPFYPGVQVLARALPAAAVVDFGPGCHDGSFFTAQEPPSLAFLAGHLAS